MSKSGSVQGDAARSPSGCKGDRGACGGPTFVVGPAPRIFFLAERSTLVAPLVSRNAACVNWAMKPGLDKGDGPLAVRKGAEPISVSKHSVC